MTSRKYDASRRAEAAQRTRDTIVATAFRLHGLGILDFETLAAEANVSVATVRKHFPTREILFESCTAFGLHNVALPDLELIASVAGPVERTRLAVRQTYAAHETLSGQNWAGFKHEDESAALAGILAQIGALVGAIADLVVAAWPLEGERRAEARGLITGLLHPLTHRALRVHGGLDADQAVEILSATIISTLTAFLAPREKGAAND